MDELPVSRSLIRLAPDGVSCISRTLYFPPFLFMRTILADKQT